MQREKKERKIFEQIFGAELSWLSFFLFNFTIISLYFNVHEREENERKCSSVVWWTYGTSSVLLANSSDHSSLSDVSHHSSRRRVGKGKIKVNSWFICSQKRRKNTSTFLTLFFSQLQHTKLDEKHRRKQTVYTSWAHSSERATTELATNKRLSLVNDYVRAMDLMLCLWLCKYLSYEQHNVGIAMLLSSYVLNESQSQHNGREAGLGLVGSNVCECFSIYIYSLRSGGKIENWWNCVSSVRASGIVELNQTSFFSRLWLNDFSTHTRHTVPT